ncbi:hypothetical protein CNMCM6106_001016 [Aspergillus hiratsukae]|uniref:Uncharacterized protein n=1 Tax=Aspergillus hiratsukae TaxID=1194566 RepID=A0A8H6V119_9EURO|nr:hypothetical protein CNMCM6106_001016 [Aspergillus hiratsukae]
MQEQVSRGQGSIPPSEPQKLGPRPLLAGAKEEWDHESLKKFLHRVLILLRGIRGHYPATLRCLQPEHVEQNWGLPHTRDQPVL